MSKDINSISAEDFQKMQKIVLQRMHAKYDSMTPRMRSLPTLQVQDSVTMESILLSPDDAMKEVNALTEIGKKLILSVINHMANLQP